MHGQNVNEADAGGVILVIDDEEQMRRTQKKMLEREGYEVHTAAGAHAALEILRESATEIQVALCDLRMDGMDGLEFIEVAQELHPGLEIILMTGYGTIETAVEAIRSGAYDFLPKPFKRMQLLRSVSRALEKRSLVEENRRLRQRVSEGGQTDVVGSSSSMLRVLDMVSQVAASEATVLILGESGTGKEVVARALHEQSSRSGGPFVKVSCAALPETLLEAELFGYEKGAFTGADQRKPGRFELAHGGTLFLDEIGDIPLEMQVKLLRVLQEKEFERLGGTKTIHADVRVLAATNRNLPRLVEKGLFREDLYYRLAVIPLEIPPLRDRRDDIPLLAASFCTKYASTDPPIITTEAMERLTSYEWPGNVRELENSIERAVVLSKEGQIRPQDLPPSVSPQSSADVYLKLPLGTTLREAEDILIRQALEICHGDKHRAAKLLGINPRTITRHLKAG